MAGPMVDSENRYTENLLRYTKSNSKQITENMQGLPRECSVLKTIEESMQGITEQQREYY